MDIRILRTAVLSGAVMVALMIGVGTTSAANSPDKRDAAKATLAAQTAQFGIDNKDPFALLSAAEMLRHVKGKVAVLDAHSAGKAKPSTYDSVALLKAAKALAAADADLTKVIDGKLAQAGKGQGWYDSYGNYYCVWGWWYEYGPSGWGYYYDCK